MLCPEHASFADMKMLSRPWKPSDPRRLVFIDENHSSVPDDYLLKHSFNFSKGQAIRNSSSSSSSGKEVCYRSGACTVLNLGTIRVDLPGFHTKNHIFPHLYRSSRIFWSMTHPLQRTMYVFEILAESDFESNGISLHDYEQQFGMDIGRSSTSFPSPGAKTPGDEKEGKSRGSPVKSIDSASMPVFRVAVLDNPSKVIITRSIKEAYLVISRAVRRTNSGASPTARHQTSTYGLNPYHFFGLGLPIVRRTIELMPDSAAAMIAQPPAPRYSPCFVLPTQEHASRVHRAQLASMVTDKPSVNGCARADGIEVQTRSSGGSRVTRILAKATEARGASSATSSTSTTGVLQDDLVVTEEITELMRRQYAELSAAYLRDPNARIEVRKSHIHNWGLFARTNFSKNDMIIEYIGEKIRQAVADRREVRYEEEGVGSCYLFRLDKEDIVDATRIGGMARFINHCCEPNAYARIIDGGSDKHIVIMAAQEIKTGEEIVYDYKFPLEETKLQCFCGASMCKGSMN